MQKTERIVGIDAIKFIAMLMVIALHFQSNSRYTEIGSIIRDISCAAIPLFFMVTGWLMTNRKLDYNYVNKKIFNILKIIVVTGIIYWLIFDIIINRQTNPKFLIAKIVFCFLNRGDISVFWFLGSMILLYLIMPILNNFLNKYNKQLSTIIIIFFIVENLIFCLNYLNNFEKNIPQIFRLWNWVFYFLLGAVIKRDCNLFNYKFDILLVVVITFLFLSFIISTKGHIGAIEYYYSSFACTIYAVFIFLYCIQHFKKNNILMNNVKDLFIPVYAFHIMVIRFYHHFFDTTFCGILSPVIDYIAQATAAIAVCYLLMKIPLCKKLFSL